MRTWTKWALVAVIGAGFTWGSMRVGSRPPPPALRIADGDLDFGTAWITDALSHDVTIRNETDERVSVRLDASCECTALSPDSFSLEPGGEQVVTATLDLSDRPAAGDTAFEVLLIAKLDGGFRPRQSWVLHGRVRNPVALPGWPLRIETPVLAGREAEPHVFDLDCLKPFESIRLDGDGEAFTASLERNSAGDGRYRLSVVPRPDLDLGEHVGSVHLCAMQSDGQESPPIRVPIRSEVVLPYRVAPELTHLGILPCGQPHRETFTVESRTGAPFTIQAAVSSDPAVEIVRPDERQPVYTVTVTPAEEGEGEAELLFVISEPTASEDAEPVAFSVPVRWRGEVLPPSGVASTDGGPQQRAAGFNPAAPGDEQER